MLNISSSKSLRLKGQVNLYRIRMIAEGHTIEKSFWESNTKIVNMKVITCNSSYLFILKHFVYVYILTKMHRTFRYAYVINITTWLNVLFRKKK